MECKYRTPTFNKGNSGALDTDCMYHQDNGKHVGYCSMQQMFRCVEDVWKRPTLLSHTGIQSFLTCHYLYYLQYIRGIEVRKQHLGVPLKTGILFDACVKFMLGDTSVNLNDLILEYEVEDRDAQKVYALYRAAKKLDIQYDMNCELQKSFYYDMKITTDPDINDVVTVNGKYDRYYKDGFVETKLSGRPENYLDVFFMQSQVGTYFAVDPSLQWVTMEVTRTPALHSSGKYNEETVEEYGERCYQDIISRPSFYFIGWDKGKRTYGKTFYRSEFALDEVLERYKHAANEIKWASYHDGFYKNDRVCNNILPGIACGMLPICRHNMFNEDVFSIKQRPEPKTKTKKKGGKKNEVV